MTVFLASLLAVAVLVAAHLFSGRLRCLEGDPRSAWLSLAGGASVAYVFVHLLPELAEGQRAIAEAAGWALGSRWELMRQYVPFAEYAVLAAVAVAVAWFVWRRWRARG